MKLITEIEQHCAPYYGKRVHNEFQEKMCLLITSFAEELPDRIDEIEVIWNRLLTGWDVTVLQELHRAVHNLVGTGKTFGFPQLSVEAHTLEQILKNLMQKATSADELQLNRILQQILELKKISVEKESRVANDMTQTIANEGAFFSNPHPSNLIFVVNDDIEAAVLNLLYKRRFFLMIIG